MKDSRVGLGFFLLGFFSSQWVKRQKWEEYKSHVKGMLPRSEKFEARYCGHVVNSFELYVENVTLALGKQTS